MKFAVASLAFLVFGTFAIAQESPQNDFKIALAEHKGQLRWTADGFKIIQSSAKANGREIGIRGQDGSGKLTFLGFLFLVPEGAPLTGAKCRDEVLDQEKKGNTSLKILSNSEIASATGLPVALTAYTTRARGGSAEYRVRGFVASGDLCGDLEFYSANPLNLEDPGLTRIFSTYQLDIGYSPKFLDVFTYAQILYQTHLYQAAGPAFEKALTMLPEDGSPFPSAIIATRVVLDQAGMSYGIAGDFRRARTVFEAGIAQDPDYPLFYYNLACTDAGEKKLADAQRHLRQAFDRKRNVNAGETMPVPTKDDSFLPYQKDKEFWRFLESLQSSN